MWVNRICDEVDHVYAREMRAPVKIRVNLKTWKELAMEMAVQCRMTSGATLPNSSSMQIRTSHGYVEIVRDVSIKDGEMRLVMEEMNGLERAVLLQKAKGGLHVKSSN